VEAAGSARKGPLFVLAVYEAASCVALHVSLEHARAASRWIVLLQLAVFLGWTGWGIEGLLRKPRFDRFGWIAGLALIVLPLLYHVTTAAFLGMGA
jgi:hypothetical protein